MEKYSFRLTPAYCLFNGVAVLNQKGSEISFLMENCQDEDLQKRLAKAFKNHVEFIKGNEDCPGEFCGDVKIRYVKGTRKELKKCISEFYEKNEIGDFEGIGNNVDKKEESAAAILLLDSILYEAQNKKATDIHIENNEVRFRIQGKLIRQMDLQPDRCNELIQRIKFLSGMNVLEKRRSQDGSFIFGEGNERIYIRISTLPVIGKSYESEMESVVIRLLDNKRVPLDINSLGFNSIQLKKIKELSQISNGLLLVSGATGSGKSTTLASILSFIQEAKDDGVKIISLEDPPEYVLPKITQVKIDEKQNNSFEEILSHLFRQDPDVIMIGEIRDEITAQIALKASLTGHLVFATLHASSAGMCLLRLENLGLNRKLVASVLKGVIVQDLSYLGEEANLIADVCIPNPDFVKSVSFESNEIEIDNCFEHTINSVEAINRSLEILKKKSNITYSKNQSGSFKKNRRIPIYKKNIYGKKRHGKEVS